jgi:hypothetical protein
MEQLYLSAALVFCNCHVAHTFVYYLASSYFTERWTRGYMISIEVHEINNEQRALSNFLKSAIQVSVAVKGNALVLDTGQEKLPTRSVKTLVKKFLHQRGLEDTYRVIKEKEIFRIVKRKHGEKPHHHKKGTPPSSYNTLPYLFTNR